MDFFSPWEIQNAFKGKARCDRVALPSLSKSCHLWNFCVCFFFFSLRKAFFCTVVGSLTCVILWHPGSTRESDLTVISSSSQSAIISHQRLLSLLAEQDLTDLNFFSVWNRISLGLLGNKFFSPQTTNFTHQFLLSLHAGQELTVATTQRHVTSVFRLIRGKQTRHLARHPHTLSEPLSTFCCCW